MLSLVTLLSIFVFANGYRIEDMTPEQRAWKQEHNPLELLTIAEQLEYNAKRMANFRATIQGALFSGVFTDNAVLQREPYKSSLYGAVDTPNTPVTLTMINEDTKKINKYNANSMENGDWKITLPNTYPNGGNFSFTVSCAGCQSPNMTTTITNITFGDVYLCAGQVSFSLFATIPCLK